MISPKRSGLTALVMAALLASTSTAKAPLTTPACLAKKLKAWGDLRKCQATENGKALQSKSGDPMKCQTTFNDALAKLNTQATAAAIACRYGVNGDGTATDYDTGLQWEQKDNLDGMPNPADPHDADNTYLWNTTPADPTPPNGTAFTSFLASLNGCAANDPTTLMGGFAGHCDWRLPSIVELAGIVDPSAPGCSTPRMRRSRPPVSTRRSLARHRSTGIGRPLAPLSRPPPRTTRFTCGSASALGA